MIKIDLLLPTDYARAREVLKHEQFLPYGPPPSASNLPFRGLTFWQHWMPCNWHVFPSVYVAREDGAIIGLIALSSMGKSRLCWRIDHLVVHPDHRGRGLALELLRYVFALFGGQGVSHFVSFAVDENSAALRLFGSCGFRRCAKVTVFTFPEGTSLAGNLHLRQATSADARGLFQLFQDVLPPDIRIVFAYVPEDFLVFDSRQLTKMKEKITGQQTWYWLCEESQRQVITSAAKITRDQQDNLAITFAVHPGWKHQASEFVYTCLHKLEEEYGLKNVTVQVFDFDTTVVEAIQATGGKAAEHVCLLAREHWVRARQPKRERVSLPGIAKPAINFPLANLLDSD